MLRRGSLPETGWLWDDFSPDGARVAVSFDSGRVWIVDTRSGRPVDAPAPAAPVRDLLAGLVAGRVTDPLATTTGGTLELWDTATGTVQDTVTVPCYNGGTAGVPGLGMIRTWTILEAPGHAAPATSPP